MEQAITYALPPNCGQLPGRQRIFTRPLVLSETDLVELGEKECVLMHALAALPGVLKITLSRLVLRVDYTCHDATQGTLILGSVEAEVVRCFGPIADLPSEVDMTY